MADLNDFFAKKAQKTKKKSKVLIGEVGFKLDKTVQLEEERERKKSQEVAGDETTDALAGGDTDSEWIDPTANELTTNLEELGIKDMAASYDDEEESDHEKVQTVPVKTWGTATHKPAEEPSENEPLQPIKQAAPKKYVPPNVRGGVPSTGTRGGGLKLDINNEEAFPTLAEADIKAKEEKTKTEEMKTAKAEGWQQVGEKKSTATTSSIFSNKSSGAYRPPGARGESNIVASRPQTSNEPAAQENKKTDEKKSGKYIPPARRT